MPKRFKVQVCFSGLILFVRQGGRIRHVLFHGDPHHDPLFCWFRGVLRRLGGETLSFAWRETDRPHSMEEGGARPIGDAEWLDDLPGHPGEESFAWVPSMADLGHDPRVAPELLERPCRHPKLAARVELAAGRIRTAEFAFGQDGRLGRGRWIAPFHFVSAAGSAAEPAWNRAAAEKVVWEILAPPTATHFQVLSAPLGDTSEPEVVREFPLADLPRPLRLTLSNNPPPRSGRNEVDPEREPGKVGTHFAALYDLLAAPPPDEARKKPALPGHFSLDDSGGEPRRNVIPHWETGAAFSDCHDPEAAVERRDQELMGTIQRPICIPASGEG